MKQLSLDQLKLGKQLRKIEEMEKKLENEKVTLKQGKTLTFLKSWSEVAGIYI